MATLVEHFLATVKHLIGEPTKPQQFPQQELSKNSLLFFSI